jgi:zinc protease
VLPSGLLIVVEQDPHATAVGVVAVVHGGSSADPQGKEGLAHLVEHLTYRGVDATAEAPLPLSTAAHASSHETRWEKLIRYAATGTNGMTSHDSISFFEFGPPTRLRWLLDVEAARLAAPLAGVDEGAVSLERQVISSENELRDDPRMGSWATRQLYPLLFSASHPYGRPVSGTAASRAGLTLADARAYVAQNFHPERITLLVTAPPVTITPEAIAEHLPAALVGDAKHPVKRPVADDADAAASEVPTHPSFGAAPSCRAPSSGSGGRSRATTARTPRRWRCWNAGSTRISTSISCARRSPRFAACTRRCSQARRPASSWCGRCSRKGPIPNASPR